MKRHSDMGPSSQPDTWRRRAIAGSFQLNAGNNINAGCTVDALTPGASGGCGCCLSSMGVGS
jgi:hypothetical protein